MALIDVFLRDDVTIKPYIREASGEPVYGESFTRKARLSAGRNLQTTYKNPDGQIDQVLVSATMFCTGSPFPPKSVVTFMGVDYIVIRCRPLKGFESSHLEVYLE